EVARVAGLVARTGQPRAVARRVEPHLQVALGRRAALAVGQRVADFPERTLDRLLVAAQRLAFTCLGLFGACLEASRVEDRQREPEAERPDPRAGAQQVGEFGALPAQRAGQ